MNDLISKKDAINALKEYEKLESNNFTSTDIYSMMTVATISNCIEEITELPSVESEQKKGRWQFRKGSDCWECSECHAILESDDIVRHNFYFCYHCGADMMNEDGYMRLEGTDHE